MRRIIAITFLIVIFFLLEYLSFNLIGWWFNPQLLILLIIFFSLYLGIRHGLYAAILAGVISDSFASSVFGLNIVSFIVDAYMATFLRKYIYYRGSHLSRLILVFSICLIDFLCRFILHAMLGTFDVVGAFKFTFLPSVLVTLLLTTYVFRKLHQCVSRL
jgi:rod shape-determining protein MreD